MTGSIMSSVIDVGPQLAAELDRPLAVVRPRRRPRGPGRPPSTSTSRLRTVSESSTTSDADLRHGSPDQLADGVEELALVELALDDVARARPPARPRRRSSGDAARGDEDRGTSRAGPGRRACARRTSKPSMPGISTSTRKSAVALRRAPSRAPPPPRSRARRRSPADSRMLCSSMRVVSESSMTRTGGADGRAASASAPSPSRAAATSRSGSSTSCGLPSASSDAPATIASAPACAGSGRTTHVRGPDEPVDADRGERARPTATTTADQRASRRAVRSRRRSSARERRRTG